MRITLAQLNPIVGDVAGNAGKIRAAIDQARRDEADVLVTSEQALLGYPARDLIFRDGVVEACERAVEELASYAGDLPVILGHPRRCESGCRPFYNSASLLRNGRVLVTYDKRLLPGYDVFDEDRYFDTGDKPCIVEIAGRRLGLVICEDLWRAGDVDMHDRYPVDPVGETIDAGCDVLVCLNATPFVHGKWNRHRRQIEQIAKRYDVTVVMVNEAGGFDDLVFDGRSLVVDAGGIGRAILPGFMACTETIDLDGPIRGAWIEAALRYDEQPLRELYEALVLGVRDYVHKTGHARAVLGISGGIDSALTAVIAAAALQPENVTGVMLPSRYSSAGSLRDARALAENIGLGQLLELSIEDLHQTVRGTYRAAQLGALEGVADENVQARLRGLLLMARANADGSLVLATGNKSELAVGYSTLYGDMIGAVSVIGDVRKMQVYDLSRWINEHHSDLGFKEPPIPEATIEKTPSAELRPDQADQDTLPPYEVLDEIIERYIDREMSVEAIVEQSGLEAGLVRKFTRMIDQAEFKRYQASVILKVSPRTFGRGRIYPLAMRSETGFEQMIQSHAVRDTKALDTE